MTRETGNRIVGSSGMAADPYRVPLIALGSMFLLTLPFMLAVIVWAYPAERPHPFAEAAMRLGVPAYTITEGRAVFVNSCALCHGQDGQGIVRLGKPLRNSAYVQERSDDELFQVIANGRMPNDPLNTTGALMPARGNQGLPDEALRKVIVYLRAMQEPGARAASVEDWILASTDAATGEVTAGLVGAAQGVGHDIFVASCSSCHGARGEGMEGLGKPLVTSEFVAGKTDEELLTFIKSGRPIWDAENSTGLDMPPKGGNPALSDEQLMDIIRYIRAIHE